MKGFTQKFLANKHTVYKNYEGIRAFQVVKNLPASAGDISDRGLIPGLGRSPRGGHGYPLQYSCLENPLDRGALRALVHGVPKSRARLKHLSAAHEGIRPRLSTQTEAEAAGETKWRLSHGLQFSPSFSRKANSLAYTRQCLPRKVSNRGKGLHGLTLAAETRVPPVKPDSLPS